MKIVFFGTGEFGIPALKRIYDSNHVITAVVTQPDKEKGRGHNVLPPPIKAITEQLAPGIEVFQPVKASDPEFIKQLKEVDADAYVVIDYGQILKKELLDIPPKGCYNLHPSLLPKYRGAAPINWTIINGEKETGNTVIMMNERMDAGDIVLQEKMRVNENEMAPQLFDRLSQNASQLIVKALDLAEKDEIEMTRQKEEDATYAPKLRKPDGVIDWNEPADVIVRKVRGFQPWPCAYTYVNGKMLKIFDAETVMDFSGGNTPGMILDDEDFIVKTGENAIKIDLVQIEGKQRMTSREFLRGRQDIHAGMMLE